jgi:hypothetical protein
MMRVEPIRATHEGDLSIVNDYGPGSEAAWHRALVESGLDFTNPCTKYPQFIRDRSQGGARKVPAEWEKLTSSCFALETRIRRAYCGPVISIGAILAGGRSW